jgi:hypothetical protein
MAKILSDTPEFVDGFAEECFKKGFSEEQAAALLKTAARLELVESGDPDFLAGMEKAAGPPIGGGAAKALFKIPVNAHALIGAGAMGAGAAVPVPRERTVESRERTAHRRSGLARRCTVGVVAPAVAQQHPQATEVVAVELVGDE